MAGNAQNESIHGQLDNDGLATFLAALRDVSRPVISQWFRSGGTVEWKSDDSPVTMADKAAELALRNAIIAAFPDDEILGEEHAARQGSSGYSWVIDPIDGTRAFICGRPVFGTLVGLVRDDVPVAGLIDMPMLDECYVAVGDRATLNGKPISTSGMTSLAGARIATTSPEALLADSLPAFNRLSAACATNLYGGDCLMRASCRRTYRSCAGRRAGGARIMGVVQLITAAGGVVTDKTGARFARGTSSLLAAATPALHAAALEVVASGD